MNKKTTDAHMSQNADKHPNITDVECLLMTDAQEARLPVMMINWGVINKGING